MLEPSLRILLHQLKHHGSTRVLGHLVRLGTRFAFPAISEALRYFSKRVLQLQYPQFRADGWPIGSGSVECGNKVVMQARLKGAGMRWERTNVNPMLALRSAIYSERWTEAWQQQERWRGRARHWRRQQRTQARCAQRRARLQAFFLRLWLFRPNQVQTPLPTAATGCTPAQRRWDDRPFLPGLFICVMQKFEGHPICSIDSSKAVVLADPSRISAAPMPSRERAAMSVVFAAPGCAKHFPWLVPPWALVHTGA